jgi:ATP-dependent Clp protease adaptor protein ClpS
VKNRQHPVMDRVMERAGHHSDDDCLQATGKGPLAYPLFPSEDADARAMRDHPRYDVVLLNDNETPMEFGVRVLEVFFDMSFSGACTLMFRAHGEGKAICGTYSREEAQKRVTDILAFADEYKYPLKCILEEAD